MAFCLPLLRRWLSSSPIGHARVIPPKYEGRAQSEVYNEVYEAAQTLRRERTIKKKVVKRTLDKWYSAQTSAGRMLKSLGLGETLKSPVDHPRIATTPGVAEIGALRDSTIAGDGRKGLTVSDVSGAITPAVAQMQPIAERGRASVMNRSSIEGADSRVQSSREELARKLTQLPLQDICIASRKLKDYTLDLVLAEVQRRGLDTFDTPKLVELAQNFGNRVHWRRLEKADRASFDLRPIMAELEGRVDKLSRDDVLVAVHAGVLAFAIIPGTKLVPHLAELWTGHTAEVEEEQLLALVSAATSLQKQSPEMRELLKELKKSFVDNLDVLPRSITVQVLFELSKNERLLVTEPELLNAVDRQLAHSIHLSPFGAKELNIAANAYFLAGFRKSRVDFVGMMLPLIEPPATPLHSVKAKAETMQFLNVLQYSTFCNSITPEQMAQVLKQFVHRLIHDDVSARELGLAANILSASEKLRNQLPSSVFTFLSSKMPPIMRDFRPHELPGLLLFSLLCNGFPNVIQKLLHLSCNSIHKQSPLHNVVTLVTSLSYMAYVPHHRAKTITSWTSSLRPLRMEELLYQFHRLTELCEGLARLGIDAPPWTDVIVSFLEEKWSDLLSNETDLFLRTLRALSDLSRPFTPVVTEVTSGTKMRANELPFGLQSHRHLLSLLYSCAKFCFPHVSLLSALMTFPEEALASLSAEESWQLVQLAALVSELSLSESALNRVMQQCHRAQCSHAASALYDEIACHLGSGSINRRTRYGNGLEALMAVLIGKDGVPMPWALAGKDSVDDRKELRDLHLRPAVIRVLTRKDYLLFREGVEPEGRVPRLATAVERKALEASGWDVFDLYLGDWLCADDRHSWLSRSLKCAFTA